jgi:putative SOS response-associated peptidase YedK
MCTLYSINSDGNVVATTFRTLRPPRQGWAGPPGEVFPDRMGPVIRLDREGNRELLDMRWGFPPPPNVGRQPVVNVRNVDSGYWRAWLKPEFRCLVPFDRFCEWTDATPKRKVWFAPPDGGMAAFAGIWRPWTGVRGTKKDPLEGDHLLYSFLTTAPNDIVGPVHAKAMPVILSNEDEWDAWLTAPVEDALEMQQPAPPDSLVIVPVEEAPPAAPKQGQLL